MSNECNNIHTGMKLICYGNECVIEEVSMVSGTVYVKLSFSTVNGHKTGTDGWYNASRLLHDKNVLFIEQEKSEEYAQVYHDLSNILYNLGSVNIKDMSDVSDVKALTNEELGGKIRTFCATYGNGGSIDCEGLARIILSSCRTSSLEDTGIVYMDTSDYDTSSLLEAFPAGYGLTIEEKKEDYPVDKIAYISPAGFAGCIDSIFSNYIDRIAEFHGVALDRDNITVDMIIQWLNSGCDNFADRFGFYGFDMKAPDTKG